MSEPMEIRQTVDSNQPQTEKLADEQELVRQIAERVWELLKEDLRIEKERRGD